jgi:hypothetical protein
MTRGQRRQASSRRTNRAEHEERHSRICLNVHGPWTLASGEKVRFLGGKQIELETKRKEERDDEEQLFWSRHTFANLVSECTLHARRAEKGRGGGSRRQRQQIRASERSGRVERIVPKGQKKKRRRREEEEEQVHLRQGLNLTNSNGKSSESETQLFVKKRLEGEEEDKCKHQHSTDESRLENEKIDVCKQVRDIQTALSNEGDEMRLIESIESGRIRGDWQGRWWWWWWTAVVVRTTNRK